MVTIDKHWSDYYAQDKDFKFIGGEELQKFLAYLPNLSEKTAFDIGCGTGQLTRELFHRGFVVTGIDASSEAIKRARHYTVQPINYIHGDIEEGMPSEDSYDLITCKLVYAFIKNKNRFLSGVLSSLNRGGIFVLITPTKEQSPDKPGIAVDHEQTVGELSEFFGAKFYDYGGLRTYICFHRSL